MTRWRVDVSKIELSKRHSVSLVPRPYCTVNVIIAMENDAKDVTSLESRTTRQQVTYCTVLTLTEWHPSPSLLTQTPKQTPQNLACTLYLLTPSRNLFSGQKWVFVMPVNQLSLCRGQAVCNDPPSSEFVLNWTCS